MKSQLRLRDESTCAVAMPPPSATEGNHAEAPPPPPSRDQLRSRRVRPVRARTESVRRLAKRDLEAGRALYPPDEHAAVARPRTRADCVGGVRPCPWVSCKHHLYLDVSAKSGAIKINFPDVDPSDLVESCSLDVADRGGVTLEATGVLMNLTRERIRQLEVLALAQLEARDDMYALREHYGDFVPRSKRRLPLVTRQRVHDEATEEFDPDEFASADLDEDGA